MSKSWLLIVLLNVFIEEVIKKLQVKSKGVKINGKVHHIRFEDDIAMKTETVKDTQKSLVIFNEILKRYLIRINTKKTKVMVITKMVLLMNIQIENSSNIETTDVW